MTAPMRESSIVGGAGFIGSHFVGRLLGRSARRAVTVFDNFSSGRAGISSRSTADPRLHVVARRRQATSTR